MKPYTICKRCGARVEDEGGALTYGHITLSAKKQTIGWSIQTAELCEECQISFQHWLDDPQYDNENYILKGDISHGCAAGICESHRQTDETRG